MTQAAAAASLLAVGGSAAALHLLVLELLLLLLAPLLSVLLLLLLKVPPRQLLRHFSLGTAAATSCWSDCVLAPSVEWAAQRNLLLLPSPPLLLLDPCRPRCSA
jgi:hypothetical protein